MTEYPWSMSNDDGTPDTSRFAQDYLHEKACTTLVAAALRHIVNGTPQERVKATIPWRMTTYAEPVEDIQRAARLFSPSQSDAQCEMSGLFYINARTATLLRTNINTDDLYGYRKATLADSDRGAIMRIFAERNLPLPVVYDEGWIEHDGRTPQSRSHFKAFVPDDIVFLLDRSLSRIIVLDVS